MPKSQNTFIFKQQKPSHKAKAFESHLFLKNLHHLNLIPHTLTFTCFQVNFTDTDRFWGNF